MDNNFVLNVIWKEEKITKVDDEQLSNKVPEQFYFNSEDSTDKKFVFGRKDIAKEMKRGFIYLIVIVLLLVVGMNVMEKIGSTSTLVINISVVVLIAAGVTILGILLSPFYTYSKIYFGENVNGNKALTRQNVFGTFSQVLNISKVDEFTITKGKLNNYILIAEKNVYKMSENSVIFIVANNDPDLLNQTVNMLKKFSEKQVVFLETT